MQDYKPQFQKVQRHAYRKVILFAVIALIATAVIFQFDSFETTKPTEPAKTPFVIQKLKIPGNDSKIPDSTPVADTQAPIQPAEPESIALSRPVTQNTNTIDIAEQEKAEPAESLSSAARVVASVPVTDRPTMSATWESRVIKSGDSLANIFREGNPAGIKALSHHLGICLPQVRLPLVSASRALTDAIGNYLDGQLPAPDFR